MSAQHPDLSNFTVEDLHDPTVEAHTLQELAATRPDLWPAILNHPNTYPDLAMYIRQKMHEQAPPPPGGQPHMSQGYGTYSANPHHGGHSMYQGQPPLDPGTEKAWGVIMPLAAFFFWFLSPLVIWLIFKDRSPLLDAQGRRALNWTISFFIYYFLAGMLTFVFIGFFFLGVLVILDCIFAIIGAVKAGNGQTWKYPMSIPFFAVNSR